MICQLPSDIEMSFPYKELVRMTSPQIAAFLTLRLWSDLTMQTRVHGRTGVYQGDLLHHYLESVSSIKIAKGTLRAEDVLLRSKILRKDGDDYFCPIFHEYNAHLDHHYIPPTFPWLHDWTMCQRRVRKHAIAKLNDVHNMAWTLPDGSHVTKDEMERAMALIYTLDVITCGTVKRYGETDDVKQTRRHQLRDPERVSIGAAHSAVDVIRKYGDARVATILRRFMSKSRPRLDPLLPPTTEQCLKNWSQLLALIKPDEGWDVWERRLDCNLSHPDDNDPTARTEAIRAELERTAITTPAVPGTAEEVTTESAEAAG